MAAKNSVNNVSSFNNSNIASINYIVTPNSGSISSNVLQNSNFNRQPNMMKIIRGGNGRNNNNFFFSKMLNSGKSDAQANPDEQTKINLEKLKKKKHEEMKIYENDDLNNSNGSESIDVQRQSYRGINSSRKEKGGIFGFFSKLIQK